MKSKLPPRISMWAAPYMPLSIVQRMWAQGAWWPVPPLPRRPRYPRPRQPRLGRDSHALTNRDHLCCLLSGFLCRLQPVEQWLQCRCDVCNKGSADGLSWSVTWTFKRQPADLQCLEWHKGSNRAIRSSDNAVTMALCRPMARHPSASRRVIAAPMRFPRALV